MNEQERCIQQASWCHAKVHVHNAIENECCPCGACCIKHSHIEEHKISYYIIDAFNGAMLRCKNWEINSIRTSKYMACILLNKDIRYIDGRKVEITKEIYDMIYDMTKERYTFIQKIE